MYYVVYYQLHPTIGTFVSLNDIINIKSSSVKENEIINLLIKLHKPDGMEIKVTNQNTRVISYTGPFNSEKDANKYYKKNKIVQHKYSFSFQWHFTKLCNQNCVQCYLDSSHFSEMHDQPELEIEQLYEIIDKVYAFCNKIEAQPIFALTGGHPLISSKLELILKYIDEKYRKHGNLSTIYILGNPQFLKENLPMLEKYFIHSYQISLDGLKETHDKWRGTGSFDTSINSLKLLSKTKIQPRVMATVSKQNANEIPALFEYLCKINLPSFTYSRVVPNKSEKYSKYFTEHFTPNEYKEFLEKMYLKIVEMREKGYNTAFAFKDHLWKPFLIEKGVWSLEDRYGKELNQNLIYDGCHINQDSLCIGTNGDVFACMRVNSKLGNILESDLEKIYCSVEAEYFRNYDKYEGCSICKFKNFCRGCHAVADGLYGDFYKADPQCWIAENLVK